jgi:phosphate starvation-inducible PhoH-like protein
MDDSRGPESGLPGPSSGDDGVNRFCLAARLTAANRRKPAWSGISGFRRAVRTYPHPIDLPEGRTITVSPFFLAPKLEALMTKRALKRMVREGEFNPGQFNDDGKVRRLPIERGWSPMGGHGAHHNDDEGREQGYLKTIKAKSDGQAEMMKAIDDRNMVMALGPAGTGKTYLAIAKAVEALEAGKVGRIVLSRPAVEAGESIGFLPGEMEDKLAPYLRPLYDALSDRLSMKRVRALMAEGAIEIAPVGFMRGRTLNNAFVVIDEAQNCTYVQLKMLLTRLGWHSTMVITGDPNQSDLLPGISGLGDVADRLEAVAGIAVVRLKDVDIVRHPLVASMLGVL